MFKHIHGINKDLRNMEENKFVQFYTSTKWILSAKKNGCLKKKQKNI